MNRFLRPLLKKWENGRKLVAKHPLFSPFSRIISRFLTLEKQAQIRGYSASISVSTCNYLQEEKQVKSNRELFSIHEVQTK